MESVLVSIIGALVAGAVAKSGEVGGKAIADAYDGLKSLVVRKLGKGGAVQSVEDEPSSEAAQGALAEAMAKAGVATDAELASKAKELEEKLAAAATSSKDNAGDIDVGNIRGKVNAVVERLVAAGHIKLGDITAETGDARLSDLTAGGASQKKT
jgi:hypothetical protein